LRELEIINKYLGGFGVIISGLKSLNLPEKFSVMDLGAGGGDTLRAVAGWMKRAGKTGPLTGVDYNPVMIKYAQNHAQTYPEIAFRQMDIFDPALNEYKADVVTCSLFCHHFEHESLVRLLRRMMELADSAVVINDLHRHWLAYYSIKILTGIFSKTYMVKHDAAVSVARAFKRKDWVRIMADAGIRHYELKWKWAFRWLVIIKKEPT
jgi:2-polyprenyl-3-methyl-5-hydroxy-6-metoxy-1,4-benzoquinol methylase